MTLPYDWNPRKENHFPEVGISWVFPGGCGYNGNTYFTKEEWRCIARN